VRSLAQAHDPAAAATTRDSDEPSWGPSRSDSPATGGAAAGAAGPLLRRYRAGRRRADPGRAGPAERAAWPDASRADAGRWRAGRDTGRLGVAGAAVSPARSMMAACISAALRAADMDPFPSRMAMLGVRECERVIAAGTAAATGARAAAQRAASVERMLVCGKCALRRPLPDLVVWRACTDAGPSTAGRAGEDGQAASAAAIV